MKFLVSPLVASLQERELRQNVKVLLKYLAALAAIVVLYSLVFRALMRVEGQEHSWITGFYWTLTVMSTLGFGDITFDSDLGRFFSMVVLLTGIVLLLIVLPLLFIRHLYAPWLEAHIKTRAPRRLPEQARDHVVLARYDAIARGLIERLDVLDIPYVVLEPDPTKALAYHDDGIRVVAGEPDTSEVWRAVCGAQARLVVANLSDAVNTNLTLTLREQSADVPIVAIVEDKDAVDILELSGATRVVPLKHRLGEQLAGRVTAGMVSAQIIGRFRELVVAEFPVQNTPLVGRSIRDTHLRRVTGLSVIGIWERGRLLPAHGETLLTKTSVAVVVGTEDQILELNEMFVIYRPDEKPVLVIGGGKVGRAASRALKNRELTVHVIDENPSLRSILERIADRVIIGDGADREVMLEAGIEEAPSVVLTTHDDDTNIYLAVYCRRLNPGCRIVCRITEERNLEAIQRAGADFTLSESELGVKTVLSFLQGRELLILGEDLDVYPVPVPSSIAGKTLAESGIGAKTGLSVIGLQNGAQVVPTPGAETRLEAGASLLLLGTEGQRQEFARLFDSA